MEWRTNAARAESMQKLINVIAILGFFMSGSLTAGVLAFYTRIPSILQGYVSDIELRVTEAIVKLVPSAEDFKVPELPEATGPAILKPEKLLP